VLHGELAELIDTVDKLLTNKLETLTHDDDIGVVTNIAGSSAEMDDSLCCRALNAVSINVAHYVVANLFLTGFGNFVVDVILMCLKFINLLFGNVKTQLMLSLSESYPELSPCTELIVL
jgi:hypothetical protein